MILGVLVMTVGVYGVIRMPDTYTGCTRRARPSSWALSLFGSPRVVTGNPEIILRAILIAAFLMVTTPISALVIARAALLRGEKMETPGALDESGKNLRRPSGPVRWSGA